MPRRKQSPAPRTIWAYAYEIVPPQPEDRLRGIKTLLDHEHSQATLGARTWKGRFVREDQITHILVVSDSPDLDRDVNRRLEAELNKLKASYSLTAPMAVVDDAPALPPAMARLSRHESQSYAVRTRQIA